jgi:pimeloyl-ACP methyl ester carboxylesterase
MNDMIREGPFLLEDRLPGIQVPTLVVWGEHDRILHPSAIEKFRDHVPDCKTVLMKDCAHVPFRERPKEAEKLVRAFFNSR